MSELLCHVLSAYLMNSMYCEIISCRKSADVSGKAFPHCCTDSSGTGETILIQLNYLCSSKPVDSVDRLT